MTDDNTPITDIAGGEMSVNGNALRTRIAAVLRSSWPAPWFDGGRQHQQVADLADAVIRELEPELNRHDTGCVCDDCWPDQEGD